MLSEFCRTFGGAQLCAERQDPGHGIAVHPDMEGVHRNNVFELSRKFGVSTREIQFVLARMRRSEMRKIQGDMFTGMDAVADGHGRKNGRAY